MHIVARMVIDLGFGLRLEGDARLPFEMIYSHDDDRRSC
jgi:hypothetical protein